VFLQHLRCCEGTLFYIVMFVTSGEYCTLTTFLVFIVSSWSGLARFSGIEIDPLS